ncbi:MAG: hypothetical protein AB1486_18305 [Planctomycetota bacterium]
MRLAAIAVLTGLSLAFVADPALSQIESDQLSGMRARCIGPATMSGRVASIAGVVSNPDIVYVGAASGGVWKSENGGLTWQPIFDKEPVASIGAIAVFQASPDIVWVGTGEGNPRNSASVGNGVYQSLDGGRTWAHRGLDESERIPRIVLHPSNPDVAYVAAMGAAWGENAERGVFRTVDGGRTWEKVLYVDEKTGAADLVMDPSNPKKLFAALWEYRRWPWFFRSGGPSSGLYVTHDGGDHWKKLTKEQGLPAGDLGRIGLAICESEPEIVYALVEASKSVLLRSSDGGESFRVVNQEKDIASRPFYFADLRVDPRQPNRVYNLGFLVTVSIDGGKTFEPLVPWTVHPDHHALWIDPSDPSHLINGNDGGVAVSQDYGKTWRFVGNLPIAQYYHISVDTETPYNVYGGMQDNGSWRGPSAVWENGGIRNHHWQELSFGDGFGTLAHPDNATIGYSMSQEGELRRWNLRTGQEKSIQPPAPEGVELRFNWNAAIAIDPFDSNTVYYGSQFVHKSPDRGDSWTIISPDLTTNNPEWQKQAESGGLTRDVTGAENYTTIITIAPSPVEPGILWVGTDDGRVQLTRDNGATWTSLEASIHGVPPGTYVPHIEASKFDAASAFVVFDDHRRSNWTPYVFKTSTFGRTWTNIAPRELWGYALVLEQDPVGEELLFLGTEFGLYVSFDGGRQWMRWTQGYPTASTMALVVHPRDHDLVIGTHGRSAFVIDDIRPLRHLTPEALAEPLRLFEIPEVYQHSVRQTGGERFPGHGEFRGENLAYGALITFSVNDPELEAKETKVAITIADGAGASLREIEAAVRRGVNRVVWDLRRKAFKQPGLPEPDWDSAGGGPEVPAGSYQVTLRYGDHEARGTLQILPDPRLALSDEERLAKWSAICEAGALQEVLAEALQRIGKVREDIEIIVTRARRADEETGKKDDSHGEREDTAKEEPHKALLEAADALKKKLTELEERVRGKTVEQGFGRWTGLLRDLMTVMGSLQSTWEAPTAVQQEMVKRAKAALEIFLGDFNKVMAEDVAAFRTRFEGSGLKLLPEVEPLSLPGAVNELDAAGEAAPDGL